MSHLSILPTVLRDETLLAQALEDLSLPVERHGVLEGFADDRQPVALHVRLPEGVSIGWAAQADGSLALVGDLQRLSRSRPLQTLLGQITKRYAARLALQSAARDLPNAQLDLVA